MLVKGRKIVIASAVAAVFCLAPESVKAETLP